ASVACDLLAVYVAFLALGLSPRPGIVVMGFVLAMSGLALMAVPGGGGSFETIMAAFYASHGLEPSQSIAVAILYRVVAFWLPVLVTAAILLWIMRSRRRRIRRRPSRSTDDPATRSRGASGSR
ncbi:MAG TPA: flippase-like domain-containing protein, partial [Methylomirabilota bacterium]|nr:flippase-like domain-containing protein [Methylomirabilota bacterium]